MKNIFFILLVFTAEICSSQQTYSFSSWTTGSTSVYTKTISSPVSNTMTVTYSESANNRANTIDVSNTCFGWNSTKTTPPFHYDRMNDVEIDYSSTSCYCSNGNFNNGLVLAVNWPTNASTNYQQIVIQFNKSVCAPVSFNIWNINQGSNSATFPFTDNVDISALDNTGASVTAANISIGNTCSNTITTSGNTKTITGVANNCIGCNNDGSGHNAVSIGSVGTYVKEITLKYYSSSASTQANPSSEYIIITDLTTTCSTVLPVELTSFTGKCNENKKRFEWTTASETNNDFFTLEKSTDGKEFSEWGKINGAGNSSTQKKYSAEFPDDDIHYTYYRLKQTDYDGRFSHSNVIHLNCLQEYYGGASLFPNPANDEINIHFENAVGSEVEYVITDVFGRTVKQGITAPVGGNIPVEIAPLCSGVYFLKLKQAGGSIIFPALRFIKE